jgi:hypothetical protein
MFALVPCRSIRILTAFCALSFAACGDDDDVSAEPNAETTAGGGASGKAGTAGKGGSSGKAAAAGKGGSGGKPAAGAAGGKAGGGAGKAAAGGTGGKAAAGAAGKAGSGGKAATGTGGKAATGAGGSKAGAGGAGGEDAEDAGTENVATAILAGLTPDGSAAVGDEDAGAVSLKDATATFTQTSSGVRLKVDFLGCDPGQSYPIHIHTGSSCESVTTQGAHWDVPRGEGIPDIECGANGIASVEYTRETDAAKAWTVGDGSVTDVVGHVIVVHSPDGDRVQRVACGKIE